MGHYKFALTHPSELCIILSVNSLAAAGWMVCWATDLARSAKPELCIILSVNSLAAAGWMVCWATDLARSAKSVAQQAAQIGS
jgi:hypothetical protein